MQPHLSDASSDPGPHFRSADVTADLAVCKAMLRTGSRSFFAASLLLPRAVRDPATALYAFCRLADDAVDLESGGSQAVAQLRDRLARAYARNPMPQAADRALADVVHRFAVPRTLLEALIEGFEWDANGRRYETISELQAYGARVAGTVGAMMATVMGVREADAVARACDLGVAMQLTNIARDVGEDARAGRLYLPLSWLREAGIDPDAWLAAPVFSAALAGVIQRLLLLANTLYGRVDAGVACLPADCQPGINAARFLYAEIGREVERNGFDSVTRRAVVPSRRKALLLTQAMLASPTRERTRGLPPLDETAFLVEAVTATPGVYLPPVVQWWHINARMIRLIELFERLERREQASRA